MDATGDTGKGTAPERAAAPEAEGATPAPHPASDHPFGPDGAAILATEHWSLLPSRSLIWNEALSRATVFLSVLSAATIALALLANASRFGPQTTTLALVLLPVVLFLGIAAHSRLVEINREEVELVLAMNRLRHAYLTIAPGLEPYLTTSHHNDERSLVTTYMLEHPPSCGCGCTSWSTRRPSSRPWTPPWPRSSSCWSCRRPRHPGSRWWPVRRWRSRRSGRRC